VFACTLFGFWLNLTGDSCMRCQAVQSTKHWVPYVPSLPGSTAGWTQQHRLRPASARAQLGVRHQASLHSPLQELSHTHNTQLTTVTGSLPHPALGRHLCPLLPPHQQPAHAHHRDHCWHAFRRVNYRLSARTLLSVVRPYGCTHTEQRRTGPAHRTGAAAPHLLLYSSACQSGMCWASAAAPLVRGLLATDGNTPRPGEAPQRMRVANPRERPHMKASAAPHTRKQHA
jgi:hypothetical protein